MVIVLRLLPKCVQQALVTFRNLGHLLINESVKLVPDKTFVCIALLTLTRRFRRRTKVVTKVVSPVTCLDPL